MSTTLERAGIDQETRDADQTMHRTININVNSISKLIGVLQEVEKTRKELMKITTKDDDAITHLNGTWQALIETINALRAGLKASVDNFISILEKKRESMPSEAIDQMIGNYKKLSRNICVAMNTEDEATTS